MEHVASDHWEAYESIIPKEKHIQTKAETFTVEGYNSLFRHFLARMRRKTKCYSKKIIFTSKLPCGIAPDYRQPKADSLSADIIRPDILLHGHDTIPVKFLFACYSRHHATIRLLFCGSRKWLRCNFPSNLPPKWQFEEDFSA
jgi:insertion element IS1 protein InsB